MPRLGRRKRQAQEPVRPCLELALCAWEDFWFLLAISNRLAALMGVRPICSNSGPALNAAHFRDFLLQIHQDKEADRKVGNFTDPDDLAANYRFLPCFVLDLFGWILHSRRIFHVDQDLQSILRATSLDGVCWSDVRLPFDAFAIELATPFKDSEGALLDFILLNSFTVAGQVHMHLRFFTVERNKYRPLTVTQKEHLLSLLSQGQHRRLDKECIDLLEKTNQFTSSHIFFEPVDQEEVLHTAARLYRQHHPDNPDPVIQEPWDAMVRIVVGLVLYLKTLPPGSPHVLPPTTPFRSGLPDRKVITNRWEVCNVTSVIPLTREERIFYGIEGNQEEQRQAKYELSCHFREGHWRRPPGKGDDPVAPRTVHVRPCIVRRDRLPKDVGLPTGSVKGDLS